MPKNRTTMLWSIKEKKEYPISNTREIMIGGLFVIASPSGEPLVMRYK